MRSEIDKEILACEGELRMLQSSMAQPRFPSGRRLVVPAWDTDTQTDRLTEFTRGLANAAKDIINNGGLQEYDSESGPYWVLAVPSADAQRESSAEDVPDSPRPHGHSIARFIPNRNTLFHVHVLVNGHWRKWMMDSASADYMIRHDNGNNFKNQILRWISAVLSEPEQPT
jgi:hypothetical protein